MTTTITGTQQITLSDEGRDDIYDVSFEASALCIFRPAQLYGPVESCYPDESEMADLFIAITLVLDEQGNEIERRTDKPDPLWAALGFSLDPSKIETEIWEAFMTDQFERDA